MKLVNEILREMREDNDLKQSYIADMLGITQQQYSNYETGESEVPVRALAILADYYGVSADYLMGRIEAREGVTALNRELVDGMTVGALATEVLLLGKNARRAVVEFIGYQMFKEQGKN